MCTPAQRIGYQRCLRAVCARVRQTRQPEKRTRDSELDVTQLAVIG